jgi:hypothetical protein
MAKIDSGASTAGMANVTSGFHLQVNPTTAITQAGYVVVAGRNDDGTVVSGGKTNEICVTEGNKLGIAYGNLLWDDTFNMTAQNTTKYKASTTTQTITFSNGTVILNGSNITTTNTNSVFQTYRSFPLFAKSETRLTLSAIHTATPQANVITEFGCFQIPSNALPPTDGVFFRYNVSGQLRGVISYSGTEFQTAAMTIPSSGVNNDYGIIIQTNNVSFYVNEVLAGRISLITDAPGLGQPMAAAALPITIRHYITGSTPTTAMQFKVSDVSLGLLGPDLNKTYSETKSSLGYDAYQGQDGGTMGTTALYTNSLAANSGVVLSNTAAGGTGFGGQVTVQPTLAAGTDGIVCAYQNPSGSTTQTPRNLFVKGVKINGTVNQTITGGPVLYAYSLAYGNTAVSLATTTTSTTKAPVFIPLGYETFGVNAVSGTTSSASPSVQFTSPIMVCPGEFVSICAKNLGTVTSAGLLTINVTFDAYYD